jgi:alkylation response protein AidB-like acyl-CoA dehydrogenase
MVIDTVEELARANFGEKAGTWNGETPWENLELLAEQGFHGLNFDETYGGGGMDDILGLMMTEATGFVCPDTCWVVGDQHFVGPRAIAVHGDEAVKEKYLPGVVDADHRVAIAMGEPGAGSDTKAMNTTVESDGDGYVINGEKIWVSDVPESTAAVVWAKFPENGGVGSVVMDFDAAGVDVAQHFTNMADHHQTQFYMEDVHIPAENVLTNGENSFKEQLLPLNWERLASAAMSNGMAANALEKALEYSQDREQFDQPIADFQGIEWKLADMVKKLEASRMLTYRAARNAMANDGIPDPMDTMLAKLYSAEIAEEIATEALQVHGANGYQQGHLLEYLYRFARGQRIAAGTDEIQRNVIASLLKRNGVPSLT